MAKGFKTGGIKKSGITIKCGVCSAPIYVMPFQVKSGRKKFCSRDCLFKSGIQTNTFQKGHKDLVPQESRGHTDETKQKISESSKGKHAGELAWNWIPDRTVVLEKHRIRSTQEWKNWRMAVFERDKYTCQECGDSGVYLEPHHIVPIRSDWNKLFNTKNGITLCRPCHQKTIWKETDFADKYLALTNSK